MGESLVDLRKQLKNETSFDNDNRERASLKAEIKAKKFGRTKTGKFFSGLSKVGAVAGGAIQKSANEVHRREAAKKKSGSKPKRKGVYNLYGERIS